MRICLPMRLSRSQLMIGLPNTSPSRNATAPRVSPRTITTGGKPGVRLSGGVAVGVGVTTCARIWGSPNSTKRSKAEQSKVINKYSLSFQCVYYLFHVQAPRPLDQHVVLRLQHATQVLYHLGIVGGEEDPVGSHTHAQRLFPNEPPQAADHHQ